MFNIKKIRIIIILSKFNINFHLFYSYYIFSLLLFKFLIADLFNLFYNSFFLINPSNSPIVIIVI